MRHPSHIRRKPAPKKMLILDEAHLLLGSPVISEHLRRTYLSNPKPNPSTLATQAMMRFNSGKRIRFLGRVTRADGSPLKPFPKKFVPKQVVRRTADTASTN